MASKNPVLIVGGGLAGLATAALLQARGSETLVLEARSAVGGRLIPFASGGVPLDAAWGVERPDSAIERARREAGLPAVAKAPLAPKAVLERAGSVGMGSVGFVLRSGFASWGTRMSVRSALAKSHRKEDRLDQFYIAEQMVGDAGQLMDAFAGPAAAETRSNTSEALAFAREVVLDQARIVGFEGSLESWVSQWRAKAGEIRTGAAVERVVIADGRVQGVALAGGEEIAGSSVVLAIGGSEVKKLFAEPDWLRLPGDERFLLEAIAPRPGLSVGFDLREPIAEPFFAFVGEPAGWAVGLGNAVTVRVGLPLGELPTAAELARLAEKAEKAIAKLVPNFAGAVRGRAHAGREVDDPAAPLGGGRARPPVALGGFDNLFLAGESTNAPHFGLERLFGSALRAAKLA